MQNDYSNKQGQDAADKTSDFVKSAGQKIEEKGKHIGGDTSKMFKEGKEEMGRVIETVDRQVHDRPWLMIACVAVGSFLIGGLFSRSK